MSVENAFDVAAAVLISLGGGGAIVFALSNFLGKVWAERMMVRETAHYNRELESVKATLQAQVSHFSLIQKQKIELYVAVSNPLIDLIVKAQHSGGLTPEDLKAFDKSRLTTTALLAMFAPINVFDEYNSLIDYIYNAFEGKEVWSFPDFRVRALKFLSLVRKDIGLYTDTVSYNGTR
jgi:hypothetical protein